MILHRLAGVIPVLGLVCGLFCGLGSTALARPFVAIVADAEGTETTDLLAPYAILAASGAVDVKIVAADRRTIRLMPGMAWVDPQATFAEAAQADVVIVPAMHDAKDPAIQAWLKAQAARGARIMSICDGAIVLAEAGLLDGREATVHWFSRDRLARRHTGVQWRQDRRWVTDGRITTTAGISASAPASLALLADLAGEAAMRATAARLNLAPPTPEHDGAAFRLTAGALTTAVSNSLSVWRRENVAIPIADGFDELAFAIRLDGWSRTYRSTAWAVGEGPVASRYGLRVRGSRKPPRRYEQTLALRTDGFDGLFRELRQAYGGATARFVALQLEHPYGAVCAP
jgi:putative intracellular protease/amidase